MEVEVHNLKDKPELIDQFQKLIDSSWPQIALLDDQGMKYWFPVLEKFPECQFGLFLDEELVAVGNCAPVSYLSESVVGETEPFADLPDTGWSWAIRSAIESDLEPNVLCALSATVNPNFRRRGLARKVLEHFKKIAADRSFQYLIAPVRPSLKHLYPLIPIADYVQWSHPGRPCFDPWIATHLGLGGRLVKTISAAMTVTRRVSDFAQMFSLTFASKGEYLLPGALCPMTVDPELELARYKEPGVWLVHDIID